MAYERKKGNVFSITIRPRQDLPKFDIYRKYFDKQFTKYHVGLEGDGGNHYQCIGVTKDLAYPHNIKQSLVRLSGFTDPDERKRAVCVKLHADEVYLLGYTSKEGQKIESTGFTEEDYERAQEALDSGVGKFNKFDNRADKFTLNQIAELFVESYLNTTTHLPISNYMEAYLTEVSPFISYQTYQKIKKDSFEEYLEKRVLAHRNRQNKVPTNYKTKNKNYILILNNYTDYQYADPQSSQEDTIDESQIVWEDADEEEAYSSCQEETRLHCPPSQDGKKVKG